MIFVWIGRFISWIRFLLVPPDNLVREIDINAPCPNCGHRQGSLSIALNGTKPSCLHRCLICTAQWFEPQSFQPTTNSAAVVTAPLAPPETIPPTR